MTETPDLPAGPHPSDTHATHDALDADEIRARLAPHTRAGLAELTVVDEIDSTNSALLRARTPARGLTVLFAERQSGGRGRLGRVWTSPPGGNLYLSLARRFEGGLARLGGLSLATGVAVAEVARTLGAETVGVKWPNDLVAVDGARLRKLGGILIEGGLQDGAARAVIGLGLNVRMPRDAAAGIDQPWTDLHALLSARAHTCNDHADLPHADLVQDGDAHAAPSRIAIAAHLVDALHAAFDRFDRDGLAPFLDRYAALDALYGHPVDSTHDGEPCHGIADGIDADGALRLRTATGTLALRAGEVSVRRAS